MIIALIGMPGCGKTSIAKALADTLNKKFIDIDSFIELKYGKIDDLFKISENHFRDIETKALKECLLNDDIILSTGGGIIIKEINRELLKDNCITIFINRKVEDIINTTNFSNRPLLKENIEKIHVLYDERIDKYYKSSNHVINSNNVFNDTIDKILKYLNSINKKV